MYAAGLALAIVLCGLPWRVSGIMLAGSPEYYSEQQRSLVAAFAQQYLPSSVSAATLQEQTDTALQWVQRATPRKFGKVLPGEIQRCRQIAQRHGILVDPIWTLASWEVAEAEAAQTMLEGPRAGSVVVILHTGGMLGLCGLAQRYPNEF